MRKTLFWKVFGGSALIILGLGAVIALSSFSTIRSHYQDTLTQELESLGRALATDIRGYLERDQAAEMDAYVKRISRDIQARVTVIAADGKVLADSERDPGQMENHKYRSEVTDALEGRIGKSLRYSVTIEEKMLYLGLPLEINGRVTAVIRLSLFMRNVDVLLGSLRVGIGRAIALMTLAGLLMAFFLSLSVARPIRKLTRAAGEVEAGRFDTRVILHTKDDFFELGEAFNLMTGRIGALFAESSRQKESLANILASIDEGLLALDAEGRVVLANGAVRRILGELAPEGKYYWEVVRKPRLQEFISGILDEAKHLSAEVRVDDRTLLCTGGALDDRGGIVLTLHDITDLRNIEAIKRDFIVNASHELRTPLAAILGAAETLEDEPGRINAASLEILKRHAERLRAIVEDLLKLSELEEKGYRLERRDIDPGDLARNVLQILAPRFKDKGLEARIEAADGLPRLAADPFLLEQMLINLVDNAIKYTDKGSVTIALSADAREYVLAVRDTGAGIPAEHLPRIFERFYVVDKSRSRKVGGTGLGLSIVKHIVQLHGGTISAASEMGQGTTFTVRLPLRGV
jgi:two-component system, OmpR family, phosphate regulon sensor histidine kinase PhoR